MNPHSPPQETVVEKPKVKRTVKPQKKVAPLRIKLPKSRKTAKKPYDSEEEEPQPEDDDEDYTEGKYTDVSAHGRARDQPKRSGRRNPEKNTLKEPEEDEFSELMEMKESGPIEHNEQCGFCKDTGELLVCETCPRVYHLKCLNPPQREVPEGAWYCQFCASEPIPARIAKMLSWRWHEAPFTEVDDDRAGKEGLKRKLWGHKYREYLCKFDTMCYWDVIWVDEVRMEQHSIHMWRTYHRRNSMDTEPETEDIDSFDDLKLAEKYYKYYINPDWLVIRRIINHRQGANKKEKEYLIYWRELPYSECTWEHESRDFTGLEDCIQKYWDHRKNMNNEKKKKDRNKADKRESTIPYQDRVRQTNILVRPAISKLCSFKSRQYKL